MLPELHHVGQRYLQYGDYKATDHNSAQRARERHYLNDSRYRANQALQYLAGLTILAALALHSAHAYALPIPDITCALTVALPTLAGVALETIITLNERLAAKGHIQTSRILQLTLVAFLIYETVLATLAGTHISPPMSLNCALKERWEHLFSRKNGDRISKIQDAFTCCGLNSPRDMAFPFPDSQHESNACMVRYERDTSCMEPWRNEEQRVAIMLLVVPLAVFVWKVGQPAQL